MRSASEWGGPSLGRGFTVVELLVTIGVVVVVLSITLPVIGSARERAWVARSLSGHREVIGSVHAYALSNRDRHPYVYVKRVGGYTDWVYEVSDRGGEGFDAAPMSGQARVWGSVVARQNPALVGVLYPRRWESIREQDALIGLVTGSYVASSTMFARPGYFGIDDALVRRSDLGVTAQSMIAFPSRKMLFDDLSMWAVLSTEFDDARTSTYGFGDGSAAVMYDHDFSGDWVDRPYAWEVGPGHTTLDGLRGIDR